MKTIVPHSSKEHAAQVGALVESAVTRSARDLETDRKELLLPRLPFTRREAETIVRLVPEKQFKKAPLRKVKFGYTGKVADAGDRLIRDLLDDIQALKRKK